jgi:hypothetical protein
MAVGFGVAPRDALHGHDFPGVQPADPLVEQPSFPKRKPLFQAPTWPTRLRWHVPHVSLRASNQAAAIFNENFT